jgi:hypothetical protein
MLQTVFKSKAEICALLENYAVSSDNPLPTFRDNLFVPSLRVKSPRSLFFPPWAFDP